MTTPQDLLARSALFADFPAQYRDQLAQRLTRHEYQANVDVVRQGSPGDALYLIASGSIGVFVHDEKLGTARMVGQLGSLESFGEMALVTAAPRNATCTTLEPSVVYRLAREVFDSIATKVPAVALATARTFAERLRRLSADQAIPWVSLAHRQPDKRLVTVLPEPMLRQLRAVPVELDKQTLTLGMLDPQDSNAISVLKQVFAAARVRVVAIGVDDFERFVTSSGKPSAASATGDTVSVSADARPQVTFIEEDEGRPGRGAPAVSGPQLVALLDEIVSVALAAGASDIHIEQERRGVNVRYRIDGLLKSRAQPLAPEIGKPLLSRLKLLAKLDITETRRPQDGRISLTADRRTVDLRLSTMPSKFGEKAVLRILDAEANIADLKSLLVYEPVQRLFSDMVFRPHGLVLVTGPTGSGKSTTMYSAVGARRRPELNVVTVEDPIEYHLDGVTQVQVQREVTSFGSILRALLRQDPNIIMVGETRDSETARMAVEASTTGHTVITSMHTNSAIEAMYRLLDLGVERHAIANGLIGVLHQRLARKICSGCTLKAEFPQPIIEGLQRAGALSKDREPVLQRGAGCPRCSGTGYKGRVAVTELLVVNDAVRTAFSAGADLADVRPIATYGGSISLAQCAGALLVQGLTTPSEVLPLLTGVGH